jgi:hypothetical protein
MDEKNGRRRSEPVLLVPLHEPFIPDDSSGSEHERIFDCPKQPAG